MTLILQNFNDDHPFSVDELNATLDAIAGSINGLAGQPVIQFTPLGGNDNSNHMPQSGGDFTGPISAPAVLIGATGSQFEALTTHSTATLAVKGPVLKATAVSTLTQTISNPPTQAQVAAIQTALNEVITNLKASGALA